MAENKQIVRNEHYISQGLIRLFSQNKKSVFEYNLANNKIYRTAISNTMKSVDTYEHTLLKTNTLENYFKGVEDLYIPKMKKVIELLDAYDIGSAKEIIFSQMEMCLLFYYRSGAFLLEYSQDKDEKQDGIISNMLKHISDNKHLKQLSNVIINDYNFAIIKSNDSFIMSDQYLSTASLNCKGKFANTSNRTIGMNNIIIMMPLSASYYVVLYDGIIRMESKLLNDYINVLTSEDVITINRIIMENSYNKCIAMHEEELNLIKNETQTQKFPTQSLCQLKNGTFISNVIKKEVFFYQEDQYLFDKFIDYYSLYNNFKLKNKRKIGRNEKCLCGSNKKYKKCCMNYCEQSVRIMNNTWRKDYSIYCTKSYYTEMPINEFWCFEKMLPKSMLSIVEQTREISRKNKIGDFK